MKLSTLLYILIFLLYSSFTFASSQPNFSKTPVTLSDTYYFDLNSTFTKKTYRIFVSEPSSDAPKGGYSVLYSLDGNAAIPLLSRANLTINRMAKIRKARSARNGKVKSSIIPGLVVAIGYADDSENIIHYRAEDYTPAANCNQCDRLTKKHGGADLFLEFIQQELKPEIAKRYIVNDKEAYLFGHSYGGLFAVYAAMAKPHAFSKVYATSPSFWFGDEIIFEYAKKFTNKYDQLEQPLNLSLSSGEWEEFPITKMPPARLKMLKKRAMVSNLDKFSKLISSANIKRFKLETNIVPQQDHGTMMFQSALKVTNQAFKQ